MNGWTTAQGSDCRDPDEARNSASAESPSERRERAPGRRAACASCCGSRAFAGEAGLQERGLVFPPRSWLKGIVLVRYMPSKDAADLDAVETREWLDSLDYVLQSGGPAKVARLLRELTVHARQNGVKLPFTANTPYINTIPADEQALMPGNPDVE